MNFASIDLGTNSFRILIARLHKNKKIEFLYKKSLVTGLGRGFDGSKKTLAKDSIQRSLEALNEFSSVLNSYKANKVRAVATSIVRESVNSSYFTGAAGRVLGTEIEVVSGSLEARLSTIGVLKSIGKIHKTKLIVDIGGGSTEITVVDDNDDINSLLSIKLGVVSIAEVFNVDKVLSERDIVKLKEHIRDIIERDMTLEDYSFGQISEIVVTAGTPTTLAAMDLGLEHYDHNKINGYILYKNNIIKIINKLCTLNSRQRLGLKGLIQGREGLIIPGSLIILYLLNKFKKDSIIVSDGGLLEGVIFNLIEENF